MHNRNVSSPFAFPDELNQVVRRTYALGRAVELLKNCRVINTHVY